MLEKLLRKVFGDKRSKDLKTYLPLVDEINSIFQNLAQYDDDELRERIAKIMDELAESLAPLRQQLEDLQRRFREESEDSVRNRLDNEIDATRKELKEESKRLLDGYLPEVYAIVKDTCRRLLGQTFIVRDHETEWNMVPFDVQLIGGMALHDGKIAEMATGEGKTLVLPCPSFECLAGSRAHLVTVNDYLAARDAEWMGPIFNFHNLTVGCITTGMTFEERKEAYNCHVTYGMNSEFGFDYLRDNMAISPDQLVQRDFYYAIVDEVDSILIDEARTPLIISGPIAQDKNFYPEMRPLVNQVVQAQNALAHRYLNEVREELKKDFDKQNNDFIAQNLLLVKRAAPRNKVFAKMMQDGALQKLVNDTEGYFLRDKKMHELDDNLFYVVEERQNSVDLCEKGREMLSKNDRNLFVVNTLMNCTPRLTTTKASPTTTNACAAKRLPPTSLWTRAKAPQHQPAPQSLHPL